MNNLRPVGIIGTGKYVPEKILTNSDLEKMVDTNDEWIVSRTGIKERHIAAPDQATSDLAYEAAIKALESAGMTGSDLDLIIVATITPDSSFPSTACILQDKLGAKGAAAFDLSAACSGFVYGLASATSFIQSGMYNNALVIGADCLSRITDYTDRNTCVLFGDGAGAVVVGEVPEGRGFKAFDLGAEGSGGSLLQMEGGGSRLPATAETVENKKHYINMNGREVFKFAVRVMGTATIEVLRKAGMERTDVDLFVPHQANIRIIQSAMQRLELPEEKVVVNVDKYANTSAASIPLALVEAAEEGRMKAGDTVLMVGFGGGLTWGHRYSFGKIDIWEMNEMGKIAFVFPGQGSQAVGMAKDAYESVPAATEIFRTADETLGFSLSNLVFEGPETELKQTSNTQPALLTASIALLEAFKEKGIQPDYTAGHSLGEYSALVAAGVLSFADAVSTVRARGQYMEQAVPGGQGAMAAVLGADREALGVLCRDVSESGHAVELANINCPGQIVISGVKEGVAAVAERVKEAGGKRAIALEVSGPFHSSLMKGAAEKLAEKLKTVTFSPAAVPVVANVTARPAEDGQVQDLLTAQVYSPVLWEDSVTWLIEQGVDTFIEIGSGSVLTGLIKKQIKP